MSADIEMPQSVLKYTSEAIIETERRRRINIFERALKNPILKLRLRCFTRGPKGMMQLIRACRLMQKQTKMNLVTFRLILRKLDYNEYSRQGIQKLFRALDANKDGLVSLAEFQQKLRPKIAECRMNIIEIAYAKVADMDGFVRSDIFDKLLEFHMNPKYLHKHYKWSELELEDIWLCTEPEPKKIESESKTEDEIDANTKTDGNDEIKSNAQSEIETPTQTSVRLTKDDFINYYATVSATVERDNYFQLLLKRDYGL